MKLRYKKLLLTVLMLGISALVALNSSPTQADTLSDMQKAQNQNFNNSITAGWNTSAPAKTKLDKQINQTLEQEKKRKNNKKDQQTKNPTNTAKANEDAIYYEDAQAAVKAVNDGTATEEQKQQVETLKENGQAATSENGDVNLNRAVPKDAWNAYAQLIMGNKNSKQKRKLFLGKGDVSVTIPYATMENEINKMTGSDGGTMIASTLATFSHYNYIETVSGNKYASQASGLLSSFGRTFGGIIAYLSSAFSDIVSGLAKLLGQFLVEFNLYHIIWETTEGITSTNPIITGVAKFFNAIGFNKKQLTTLFSFTFILITAIFGFAIMRNISNGGLNGRSIFDPTKTWFMRIIPVFILLPLFSLASGELIQTYTANTITSPSSGIATQYLVNARYWAASSNLSPAAGSFSGAPSGNQNSAYIDDTYAPYTEKAKGVINNINTTGYRWKYNKANPTGEEISRDLLSSWISNENFNVNTYAGDVLLSSIDENSFKKPIAVIPNGEEPKIVKSDETGEGDDGDEDKNKAGVVQGAGFSDLRDYIWSVAPAPNEEQSDPESYESDSRVGIKWSFSTQSTALLLQSSFTDDQAVFYAYNISPTGAQATKKNLSTVNTEWKNVALTGEKGLGQFSSWLGMTSGYLSLLIINISIVAALFHIGVFGTIGNFIKAIIGTVGRGSAADAVGTFLYFISMMVIGILSSSLGKFLYSTIISIATGINTYIFKSDVMAGFTESILLLVISYFIALHGVKGSLLSPDFSNTNITKLFKSILIAAENYHKELIRILPHGFGDNFNRKTKENVGNNRVSGYYSDVSGAVINPNISQMDNTAKYGYYNADDESTNDKNETPSSSILSRKSSAHDWNDSNVMDGDDAKPDARNALRNKRAIQDSDNITKQLSDTPIRDKVKRVGQIAKGGTQLAKAGGALLTGAGTAYAVKNGVDGYRNIRGNKGDKSTSKRGQTSAQSGDRKSIDRDRKETPLKPQLTRKQTAKDVVGKKSPSKTSNQKTSQKTLPSQLQSQKTPSSRPLNAQHPPINTKGVDKLRDRNKKR